MGIENNVFSEINNNMNEAFSEAGGVNAKGFRAALAADASAFIHKIGDGLTDAKGLVKHNDNIYVPLGQKTLIGTDFDKLYGSSAKITVDTLSTDDGPARFLRVNAGYDTELRSDFCNKSEPITYENLGAYDRAVYEISTLTKASAYAGGNTNTDVADAYKQTMDQYKTYCESSGMSWDEVLKEVSTELQAESFYYKNEKNYSQFNVTADSHRMLREAAGPDFNDGVRGAFIGEFKSCDEMMKHSTFADRVTKEDGSVSIKAGMKEAFGYALREGYRFALYTVDAARGVWDSMKSVAHQALESHTLQNAKEFAGDTIHAVRYNAAKAFDDGTYAQEQAADQGESKLTAEQRVQMAEAAEPQPASQGSVPDLDNI